MESCAVELECICHYFFWRRLHAWHRALLLREYFKFGKPRDWNLLTGWGLRWKKRFKFVSSCFKLDAEVAATTGSYSFPKRQGGRLERSKLF